MEDKQDRLMAPEGNDIEIDKDGVVEGRQEEEEEEEEEENASVNEDEDEDEEDEDGGYTFRFENGMNPLDFIGNHDSGVQCYQKLQQHEEEALANKKRKSPQQCPTTPECNGGSSYKKAREDDISEEKYAEVMESMNIGGGRRSRKRKQPKKRGRRKGSKKKLDDRLSRMLGDAILHYSNGCYDKAIKLSLEVVRLGPYLAEPYHILGRVHMELGNYHKVPDLFMFAAYLSPEFSSLWEEVFVLSIEQGNNDQAEHCLSKAINANPQDSSLRIKHAKFHAELQDFHKAAESYEKAYQLCPENVDALKSAAKFYQKCGQVERSVLILEDYLKGQPDGVNASVVDLLGAILMEIKAYDRALQYIEQSQVGNSGNELPLNLKIKAGICHIHLGNMELAQVFFNDLKPENAKEHVDFVTEIADSLMALEHYISALNYFQMLEGNSQNKNGLRYTKIARCYRSLGERLQAIDFFYKALETLPNDVDARITLASLLLEEGKEDEAISLLSLPKDSDSGEAHSDKSNTWLADVRIKLKLGNIFQNRGMLDDFVNVILPLVRQPPHVGAARQEGKSKKRLSTRDLLERVRVLGGPENDNVFRGFRPVAPSSDLLKASRAKKLLQKKAIQKEKKKAEALASGVDWLSDDSDDEPQKVNTEPALSNLLKDEKHHQLIIDLCNALAFLQRYDEALEIINLTLRSAHASLSVEKEEKLRSLGAQMAYKSTYPKHGFDCVKYIVQQHPQSVAAWNCYYKVISRLENRDTRHDKFVRSMQGKFVDCVPPILISGHQFTQHSHHQDAARKYLEAYKLLPENPLVNLCVGTALINLALGLRLQNKHQCVVQGLAFLYNNLRICNNSQESLFNMARAFHNVGLVTLAVKYYEEVLAIRVEDYPIPKLPHEKPDAIENHKPGYCDLRREAAFNLHLIYKKSGALDLARQVLKDHCTL